MQILPNILKCSQPDPDSKREVSGYIIGTYKVRTWTRARPRMILVFEENIHDRKAYDEELQLVTLNSLYKITNYTFKSLSWYPASS